jgi:hypothetical protein
LSQKEVEITITDGKSADVVLQDEKIPGIQEEKGFEIFLSD